MKTILLLFFFFTDFCIVHCAAHEKTPLKSKCVGFGPNSYVEPETDFEDDEPEQCSCLQDCITCIGCSVCLTVSIYAMVAFVTELAKSNNPAPVVNSTHSLIPPSKPPVIQVPPKQFVNHPHLPPRIPKMHRFIKTRRIQQPREKRRK